MTSATAKQAGRRLAPVRNILYIPGYEWLTAPALRHLLFQAKARFDSRGRPIPGNGLEEIGAIIRIGRKVLIDLDRFDEWLDAHRTSTSRPSERD